MYRNFRFNITLRVILIVALALLLAFVIIKTHTFFIPIVTTICLIAVTINLIRYFEKSSKDLTHFLLSIRQGAFTESYKSNNRGQPYAEFSDALNEVTREFASLNLEKELHYQYLQALNENIGVAILSFDAEGKLLMMNPAAKKLLKLPSFSSVEHFKRVDNNLYEAVRQIAPESRMVVKTFIGEDQLQLSIQAKEIVLQNKHVRIILLQNINSELEAKELEAWHQLMRVLTHEIMNSVTPIISLTDAFQKILKDGNGIPKDFKALSEENIEDVFSSLNTISSRSKGLLKFVNSYKEYSKPVELHLENTDIISLVKRIIDLITPDITKHNIQLHFNYLKDTIHTKADAALIEQVLINLLKNAVEAVPHDGTGVIDVIIKTKENNTVSISVSDNGNGMDEETVTKIFIPFYTTKPKGTGIGLSLSRQIMKLHNGTIKVQSDVNKGSIFTLEL